jgi:hypothetical protein
VADEVNSTRHQIKREDRKTYLFSHLVQLVSNLDSNKIKTAGIRPMNTDNDEDGGILRRCAL